jgi:hypothetical protein
MVVSKDIHINYPTSGNPIGPPPLLARAGTLKAETSQSEEDVVRKEKSEISGKADSAENVFIEDVRSLPPFSNMTSPESLHEDHRSYKLPLW